MSEFMLPEDIKRLMQAQERAVDGDHMRDALRAYGIEPDNALRWVDAAREWAARADGP